ncbi:MAG: hypothetical protein KJ556_17595 [Gammaproteobacteria bacterium]|nr:hypothetical protein [Gammaproteobacteria bacterium]MBU2058188.1 hypothetical protein [Gammaproteobacteria bacterium]MBU2176923.1 hypothetical protein [Gammaproteobacteria bacterium]MBU2246036.1 hypothetical protein [Gammaproteobacteria bacterium]MBU2344107.1 hypothetical protein [Gammaproteobacteria bacterium]
MSNESMKMFMNVVTERHEQYRSRLDDMLNALSNNNQAAKIEACKALSSISHDLSNLLAERDRPGWLMRTISCTESYSRKNKDANSIVSGSSWELLKELMNLREPAMAHAWSFSESNASAYDFDAVFARARNTSSVPDLFDSLIASLKQMLATGEIDSIKAIEALNKLISTLTQNKKSSYFSTIVSWQFARSFVKNALWASLDEITVVKPIKSAFEKTLAEMNVEVDRLHEEISTELKERFEIAPILGLAYDKNPQIAADDSEKRG